MKTISIDSKSVLDVTTKKSMSEVIDFSKEYVTTETDKDTIYKAGTGVSISSDNTISIATIDQGDSAGVELADETTAGITKLYTSTGTNDDGTMTQESITDELNNKAPINSPTFTGAPTAPTPNTSDTGSDRLATTAYVLSLLKNNPEIIDDILEAISNKADKTAANASTLGLVKIGNNITNSNGTISLTGSNVTSALGNTILNMAGSYFSQSSYPSMANGYEGWYLASGDGLFAGNPASNYAGLQYVSGGIALIGYQAKTKTEKASVSVNGGGGVNIKGTVNITGDLYVNGTKVN